MIFKKIVLIASLIPCISSAAVSLDRTRIIYNADQPAVSLRIFNSSQNYPFLAQAWMEDDKNEKIESPFFVTPPIQRINTKQQSQIKIQNVAPEMLPQDRESVYYFNFKQIPPRSEKANVLQLTVQTKMKLFYRPKGLYVEGTTISDNPWQEKLILKYQNNSVFAYNSTPYYTTISNIAMSKDGSPIKDIEAFMVPPFSSVDLKVSKEKLGKAPYLTYINDYGGKKTMNFICNQFQCELNKQ